MLKIKDGVNDEIENLRITIKNDDKIINKLLKEQKELKSFILEQMKYIDICMKQDGYNKAGLQSGKNALKMVLDKLEEIQNDNR